MTSRDMAVPVGVRIAGVLMVIQSLSNLAVIAQQASAYGATFDQRRLLAMGFDAVLGLLLAGGVAWRWLSWFAAARVLIGALFFTRWFELTTLPGAMQLSVIGGLLVLLVGRASFMRAAFGASLAGLAIALGLLGNVELMLGDGPVCRALGRDTARGDSLSRLGASSWRLPLPGASWRALDRQGSSELRGLPMASWSELDTVVMVSTAQDERATPAWADQEARSLCGWAIGKLGPIDEDQEPAAPEDAPERISWTGGEHAVVARRVESVRGLKVEALCGSYLRGRRRVAIAALAPAKKMAEAEAELRRMLGSLEVFDDPTAP